VSRRSRQTPLSQYDAASHCESTLQSPLHASTPQAYGAQLTGSSSVQEPLPLQKDGGIASFLTGSHDGSLHWVARGGYAHSRVVTPSQAPPQSLPSEPQGSLS
jgi:hypothetical protein